MDHNSSRAAFLTRPEAWIEVSGEDAPQFLQSQFSNDLRGDPGSAVAGLWLDHRGRIHGESVVLRTGAETFLLASLSTPAADLLKKLEGHVIADEVDFADKTAEVAAVLLFGDEAGASAEAPSAGTFKYEDSTYAFSDRLGRKPVSVFVGPSDKCSEFIDTLSREGVSRAAAAEWETWRLRHCRPAIPREVGPAESPADVGLDRLCSSTKGCYLGQEVVNRQARLERAAQSLRVVRLRNLSEFDGHEPILLKNETGKIVGSLRRMSGQGTEAIGLAMIKNKYLQEGGLIGGEGGLSVEFED